jgi:hypothetical protein
MTVWFKKWSTEEHYNSKVKTFDVLDSYINSSPLSILDKVYSGKKNTMYQIKFL